MRTLEDRINDLEDAITIHLTFRLPNHPEVQRLRSQIDLEKSMQRNALVTSGPSIQD